MINDESELSGLFYGDSEDSFIDDNTIRREMILQDAGHVPVFETPFPDNKDFNYWTRRLAERRDTMKETSEVSPTEVEIQLPDAPTMLNIIGDTHGGHYCDYERIFAEVEVIANTPNSYAFIAGDIINAMHWNPGQFEEIEQIPEQIMYARSLLKRLGEEQRLLVSWTGDHDGWVNKMGASVFSEYQNLTSGYLMHGIGVVKLNIGNQPYTFCGGHKFPGSSMYNFLHSQVRMSRFGLQGADVYFSGHTHRKGVMQQPINDIDGGKLVTYVSVGPYKPTDSWLGKQGYPVQASDELYGVSLYLDNDRKFVSTNVDILDAHQRFRDFMG